MNYSCVVFGGAIMIGLLYYFVVGKNVYKGPLTETETTNSDGTNIWACKENMDDLCDNQYHLIETA